MADPFGTSVASNLVSKLCEYLFAPIGRQFGYVLCYMSNVKDLKNEVKKLEAVQEERVQPSVDEAMRNGKVICTDIKEWLDSVKNEAKEAQKLLKQGESAKNACFRGWLPNPMARHPIGRKVKKMTQVIRELHDKTENNNFQKVYYENPPKGIVSVDKKGNTKGDVPESRALITEDVMKALITEDVMKAIRDDKISVVGLYGPGGVGKSKLLEDIERRVKKEKSFDVVVMVEVSRNPNIKTIQGDIADALGIKLMNVETTHGRANHLCRRLESYSEKKILIILDNLQSKLELKDVGIPCGDGNKVRGCKLLLSSRNREVLRIGMFSDQDFRLNELDDGEARRLFERITGDIVYDSKFKPFIDGVVKNCGGLPLFIISLAKRLRSGKLAAWRNALILEGSDFKSLVEQNYNDLQDKRIKSLFLIYAISYGRILLRDAFIYCLGLDLFNNFNKTIEDARDRLIMDLDFLQDSSLLLDSDVMEEIRMHDIITDVAISIASLEWNALVGGEDCGFEKWSKDELRECTVISFPQVGIAELPEKLDCPNLTMFLLYENNSSLKIPPSFFESMENLQVLDLSCLSITSLPSSIQFLKNLKSLCLDFCYLEDVTDLGKLKALQFLSLTESTITRLPKEIGELIELRFLDLTRCTRLKVIEPGMLGSLTNLEELYMKNSFDKWEAEDEESRSNASLTELKNMNKLSTLDIAIPHSSYLSRELPFGKLNKHKIQSGRVWDWSGEYKEFRTFKLKLDSSDLLIEQWVLNWLQKTQDLHLDGLQHGVDSIHNLCIEGFQELKHLHVRNSPSFENVACSIENVKCTTFIGLESLFLENLNNLREICRGYLTLESFSKLKSLKVDNCSEIKHLFPLSMKRIILQLEEIEISSCHLMQQIVADSEVDEDRDEIYDDTKMKSCNLRRLTLQNLPKMKNFYKTADGSVDFFDGQQVVFPSLEELELSSMCELKRIWHNQFLGQSFCKLTSLTLELCENLSHVFPSNSINRLPSLNEIKVVGCPSLEALFEPASLNAERRQKPLVFPTLKKVELLNLPRLKDILKSDCKVTFAFPSLVEVNVRDCHSLIYLFSSATAESLDKLAVLDVSCCNKLRGIIAMEEGKGKTLETLKFPQLSTLRLFDLENLISFYSASCPRDGLHPLFDGKVLFPSLEELKLSSMCKLKKIWHNQFPEQSFYKLASLTIELCENLSHVFLSNKMDKLLSLNKIEVVRCTSLEALFEPESLSSEKRQKPLALYALKKLKLLDLPKLRDIWKSDCKVTLAFPSLMEVNVRRCHSLSYLFSSAMAKTLHELVVLDVSCCNNLRGIIAMEEGKVKTVETFKFPHLTKLKLDDLKRLICFSSENGAGDGLHPLFDEKLAFPKLEELHVEGIQQKELWNDKIHVQSFCFLKVLKVKQCHNLMNVIPSSMWKRLLHCMESLIVEKCQHLRNLFTMSMAQSLGQLQYLGLGGCGEIEYIVAKEEKPKEATDKFVIPQLVTLYLHNMPKLRSFCQGKHVSEWPSLKEFIIEDCKAVEVILGDVDCGKLKSSVPTHQPLLLIEKVEFPDMESMKISHMDNMEKIWLDDLDSNALGKLKTLVVRRCEKILSIFSSYDILTRFQNLEKITVTDCDFLEVVFQVQEFEFSEVCSTSTFQLRELVLMRLPKMKHVWSGLPRGALTFGRLQCMKVVKCESLKSLFPSSVAKSMTQLKELLALDCGVEEIIVEGDRVGMSTGDLFFPQLTNLEVVGSSKLRSFYHNSHTSTWPLLEQLQVSHCSKMRLFSFAREFQSCQGTTTSEKQSALFSFEKVIPHLEGLTLAKEDVAMMPQHYVVCNLRELTLACYHDENVAFLFNFLLHRFPNLDTLNVRCSSFEEIFPEDLSGHGGVAPSSELTNMEKPLQALQNLSRLGLVRLCNLKRVWKDSSLMAEILEQIEVLWIAECPSLSIVLPSQTSFQRLTILGVQDCAGLVHMGTCSALTSLVHLTRLTLRNCGAMEDMVTDDGNGAKDISFPELKELIIDGLPSLESFSPMNCAFKFPSLVCIVVTNCPKMNILCKGTLRTPNLDEVLLSEEDDEGCWEGDLNTTIRTLSTWNDPHAIQ